MMKERIIILKNEKKNAAYAHRPAAPVKANITTAAKPKPAGQCPLYKKCGGCQLQNLDYPAQLAYKQRLTQNLLGNYAKVEPIVGMKHPYHYRNKVQAAFGRGRGGQIVSGVYQSSTHRIVPVDSCLTEDKTADAIIVDIRKLMKSFKLEPYEEDRGRGWLRHVLVKRGFCSKQIMVVLVTATPVFPARKKFVGALLKLHPQITTILQNVNPYQTSLVLGERENVLYGSGTIEETLCGLRFQISARSFYQINPVQTEVLYTNAIQFAGLAGGETVLDAYCGVGTIGLIASQYAAKVIGVELNKDAVHDAIVNARLNSIKNARFYAGDAGDFMVEMAAAHEKVDVVFMDPPRSGSSETFLSQLAKLAPARIVYISCNPETQARDLKILCGKNYSVKKILPVDMFPHTNHVETVVLMTKRKA